MKKIAILENILFFFLLAFLLASPASVAYSEIALAAVVVLLLLRALIRRGTFAPLRAIPRAKRICRPMIFWAAASTLAAIFARYRMATILKLPKLLILLLVFLLPALLTNFRRLRHAVAALILGGVITSAYGIGYYMNDPSTRLGGFVGNYMSTAGILMILLLVSFGILFRGRVGGALEWIVIGAIPVLLVALYLTNTRGAWIGFIAGLAFMALVASRRLLLVPVLFVALLMAVPGGARSTALSAVEPGNSRNRERLFMWKAGLEIFRDHPLVGVGLAGMRETYLNYRDPRAKEKAVHLHSVPIQVLASSGIVGFAAWAYLFGSLLLWLRTAAVRVQKGPPLVRGLVTGALGASAGFLVNGLVEWNIGDVEVITVFWSTIGLALAAVACHGGKGAAK